MAFTKRLWFVSEVEPDSDAWIGLLRQNEHLLFHEPVWQQVLQKGMSPQTVTLVLQNSDGLVAAGLTGVILRRLGIQLGYVSFPYGGILGTPFDMAILVDCLKEYGLKCGWAQIQLRDAPGAGPLCHKHLRAHDDQTLILWFDRNESKPLEQYFRSSARRNIRQARQAGVVVSEENTSAGAHTFYQLYRASMQRQSAIVKYGEKLIYSIVQDLAPLGRCSLLLAKHKGQVVAGIMVVDSKRMSHYLLGGSFDQGREVRANDLLFDVAIRRAATLGFSGFDFLPSGRENESLIRYKSKWGAEPVPLVNRTLVVRPVHSTLWNTAYRCAHWSVSKRIVRWFQ